MKRRLTSCGECSGWDYCTPVNKLMDSKDWRQSIRACVIHIGVQCHLPLRRRLVNTGRFPCVSQSSQDTALSLSAMHPPGSFNCLTANSRQASIKGDHFRFGLPSSSDLHLVFLIYNATHLGCHRSRLFSCFCTCQSIG